MQTFQQLNIDKLFHLKFEFPCELQLKSKYFKKEFRNETTREFLHCIYLLVDCPTQLNCIFKKIVTSQYKRHNRHISADVYCKRTPHLNFDWHCSLTLAKSSSLVMTMVISRMENYVDFYVHLEQLKVRLYLYSARTFAKLSHVSKSYHSSYRPIIK